MMKKSIIGVLIVILSGCGSTDFCGEKVVPLNDVLYSKGDIDGGGFPLIVQITMEVAKEFGDNSMSFEVVHSFADTTVINITNVESELVAKQVSCIVNKNKSIKNRRVVYGNYYYGENYFTLKHAPQ
jgi:hypothetical protein